MLVGCKGAMNGREHTLSTRLSNNYDKLAFEKRFGSFKALFDFFYIFVALNSYTDGSWHLENGLLKYYTQRFSSS